MMIKDGLILPSTTTRWKLDTLADFLESYVQDEWFDLLLWSTRGFPQQECGTTACAGGWATQCPDFAGMGLRLAVAGNRTGLELKYDKPTLDGKTKTYSAADATEQFFGIDFATSDYLFMPGEYPMDACDRSDVVRRLREIAAEPDCCVTEDMQFDAEMACQDAGGSAQTRGQMKSSAELLSDRQWLW